MAENPLCIKSYYDKKTKSVGDFQKLLKEQEWWSNCGLESDRARLLLPDSGLLVAFMKWTESETEVLAQIKESLEYREKTNVYELEAAKLSSFRQPLFIIDGKTKSGNRILWVQVRYNDPKTLDDGKRCLDYLFEAITRAEPNKPVQIVIIFKGAGMSNVSIDFIKHLIYIGTAIFPHFIFKITALDMPWIFKATWSIIKAFLSEKQKQMVNFTSLSEFEKEVAKDNWLKVIGGSLADMQLDGAAPMPAELADLRNSLKF